MNRRYLSEPKSFKSFSLFLFAALLAAAVIGPTASDLRAQGGEARRVTLFSGEGFSGSAQSWDLPPGRPYLSVSYIGEALDQRVVSARIGRDVAVVFFGRPHFAARDESCGPSLGGFQDSSLWWRGRTATHLPDRPSQSPGPVQMAKLESGAFASMIIYQRDFGPPPGALLLDRRPSYNRGCASMVHTNNYNRLFAPVPDGPDRNVCINVSAPSASPGAGDKPPKFRRIAELALLNPARLDPAYRGVVHRTRLQLFDQADCQGNSVSFPRLRGAKERFLLRDYQFRNKTRSVLVSYESGPADVAYSAPAAVPVVAVTPALPEADLSAAQPAAAAMATPSPAPSAAAPVKADPPATAVPTSADPGTATPAAVASPQPLTVPSEPPVIASARTQVPQVEIESVPAAAPESVPEPAPILSESVVAEVPAPAPVISAKAGKYSLQPPAPAPLPASQLGPKVQDIESQAQAPSQAAPATGIQQAQTTPLVVLPTDPASAPEGVSQPVTAVQLPSEAQAALTGSSVPSSGEAFRYPVHQDYRLNFCFSNREDCGAPAANAWCKAQGYSKALSWKKEANVGAIFPTVLIGTEDVCDKYLCDGFEEISCGR